MGTCLAVDGTNIVHRAYHAMLSTDMRDDEGRATWAIHGTVSLIANYLTAVRPSSLVVAFDTTGGCPSRRSLAPDYKGGRRETPAELTEQLIRVREILGGSGVACVEATDWEADDILATVATVVGQSGSKTVVVSSDKDAHQLITTDCLVYKPEGRYVDDDALVAKYGVTGQRWVEYAALVGEGADNLPGVNGVGPKRASKIIAAFDDVEQALGDATKAETLLGTTVARSLLTGAETFRRNRQVGTLRRDLHLDLSAVRTNRLDPAWITNWLGSYGLTSAAARLVKALSVC